MSPGPMSGFLAAHRAEVFPDEDGAAGTGNSDAAVAVEFGAAEAAADGADGTVAAGSRDGDRDDAGGGRLT